MQIASTAAPIGASPLVRRLGALAAAAVVGIGLAGCVASPDADEQQPATTSDGTESQAPEEATEEAEAEGDPAVGDVVSADGWDFTVVSVGEPQPSVGTAPLSNDAQGVYVPVTVTIANTATEAQLLTSDAVRLLDAGGAQFSADSTAGIYDESAIEVFGEVNPGISLTGPVYFDVPEGTEPVAVTFTGALFGGDPVTIAL